MYCDAKETIYCLGSDCILLRATNFLQSQLFPFASQKSVEEGPPGKSKRIRRPTSKLKEGMISFHTLSSDRV